MEARSKDNGDEVKQTDLVPVLLGNRDNSRKIKVSTNAPHALHEVSGL